MSDLSHCGCDNCCDGNGTSLFGGNGSCACNIIWIILILSIIGNGNGCGSFLGGNGENSSCTALIWILLLSCCCGGNSIF